VLLESLTNEISDSPQVTFKVAYKTIEAHYWRFLTESNENKFMTKDVLPFLTTLKPPYGLNFLKILLILFVRTSTKSISRYESF